MEKAAPLLGMKIDGAPDGRFALAPARPRALDPLLPALETYSESARARLTVRKPAPREDAIWLHPGEPVFDRFAAAVLDRFGDDALRGAVFVDPAADEPWLFHLARVAVGQAGARPAPLESRLVGLRQTADGTIRESPVERLLLLRGLPRFAPGRVALAASAGRLTREAGAFVRDEIAESLARSHRDRMSRELAADLEAVGRGFDHRAAELAASRARFAGRARAGDSAAAAERDRIGERQRRLGAERDRRLAELRAEPGRVRVLEARLLALALALPSRDAGEARRFDAKVEAVAMKVARAFEERFGANVADVSAPALARRAGLTDWPGFDLLSVRPGGERRMIEVKGRAVAGDIEVSENEWARACNLRDRYWLYVVFDCASPRPRLVRVRDPFGKLLAKARGAVSIAPARILAAAAD